jgi:hypothetical protein
VIHCVCAPLRAYPVITDPSRRSHGVGVNTYLNTSSSSQKATNHKPFPTGN